ncbi:MAG TPA: VOC family protein [Xanthobacteraceae bacterium]|nr:VOC family protein [Xanthobacteraceae bacterium]
MPRGLDHIVHAVRDLDAVAELYRRLGFTVGARNRHAWGTHNHVVQLPGFFVELLTVAEPEKLGSDGFSTLFGRFNQSFLARQEGLSMLLLESSDAAADAAAFRSAGVGASEAMKFEREGRRPDGSTVKVAFSLAFALDAKAPDAGFATCQQHFPENFWNPAFQRHPNTATGVAAVVLVADNPTDHHIFLSAFTGVRDLHATSSGVTAATPRGDVKVMDPAAFRSHFGTEPPDISKGARLAALQFRVSDRDALMAALNAGDIESSFCMGLTVVAPETAMGATLAFA